MSNQQYQSNTDDEQTHEQYYRTQFSRWSDRFLFRLFVYICILAFTMLHMAVLSKLFEAGMMEGDISGIEFTLLLLGLIIEWMMIRDFSKGAYYFGVSRFGKRRGYAIVAIAAALFWGYQFSRTPSLSGEHLEAYTIIAWVLGASIGLEFLPGAIFNRDVKQVRERVRGVLG